MAELRAIGKTSDFYMDHLQARLGNNGLGRIEKLVRLWLKQDTAEAPDPLQKPFRMYLPGLLSQAWHNPDEFRWAPEFRQSWELVKQELDSVLRCGVHQPYLSNFDEALHAPGERAAADAAGPCRMGWNAFFLRRGGEWIAVNAAHCPNTRRLLSSTNLAAGETLFSCLSPKTNIQWHSSGCNVVLTCHLGLVVPPRCGIRVGSETRTWEAGKILIFDDSYLHSAWNDGDEERIVLLWDIWHPELTEVEISALKYLFPLIMSDGA